MSRLYRFLSQTFVRGQARGRATANSLSNLGGTSSSWKKVVTAACTAAGLGLGVSVVISNYSRDHSLLARCATKKRAGEEYPDLPSFTKEEISQHKSAGNRVWVTYKDGVYDITEFLPQHPGGTDKLMLAAGGAIDPYWHVFPQHNTEQIIDMLEVYRVGNVAVADRSTRQPQKGCHYAKDPERSPVLKVNTLEPFNAETPPILLPEHFITSNELFFVRNHLPVPEVNPLTYALEVGGEGLKTVKLTLNDLKTKFPQHTVVATIQCAGNRREELGKVREVKGIPWTGGAIGNAEWTGVKLRDVLLYAGMKEVEGLGEGQIRHIHFEGLDKNPLTGDCYGASIPVEKALDARGDCLLVHSMNGDTLPRDHGHPLRVLVPGTVGARNVKWLARIAASRDEYGGQWQQRDYKGFSPSVNWSNVDFTTAPAIQEMPVQSLICSPQEGATVEVDDANVVVQGIAWSGGGRRVVRVDTSLDGGKSWVEAELMEGKEQRRGRGWAWVLWEATIPLPSKPQSVEICCKAIDESYNVQPDTTAPIWNLRGCLSNAWHRVHINLK